jgi:hypothetical protein
MVFLSGYGYNCDEEAAGEWVMSEKAKNYLEEGLKVFGVHPFPKIVETAGAGVAFRMEGDEVLIDLGSDADIDKIPMVDWLIVIGKTLLRQNSSDIAQLRFGPEYETNDTNRRVADDINYIADLAAIYQCYLQNPVEAYCTYDDAIRLDDKTSLNRMAVALGLSHPRGLESIGFDKKEHWEVFEEAEFFKGVITQKRPDLSLLIALQNAWQKHLEVPVKISVEEGVLRLAKAP